MEEAVLVVEERVAAAAHVLHRVRDVGVVLKELRGEPLVDGIVAGELERHPHHDQGEHPHPAGRVGLLEHRAVGEPLAPVEHADVVEPEEASLEDVVALVVDLVDPAREHEQQLVEAAFEPGAVVDAVPPFLHVVDPPYGPGMDRRVEVAEFPLVGGQLAARMLELFEEQHPELVLRELGIDEREGDGLEGEVPGGEPGILPLVGHAHDPQGVEVPPVGVADRATARRRRRGRIVAVEPLCDVEDVVLLRPEQARDRPPLHVLLVVGRAARRDTLVEQVALPPPPLDQIVDRRLEIACLALRRPVGKQQPHGDRAARRHDEPVVKGGLRADARGVAGRLDARADPPMECVLREEGAARVSGAEDDRAVRLVVGEEHVRPRGRRGDEPAWPEAGRRGDPRVDLEARVVGDEARDVADVAATDRRRHGSAAVPRPGVPEPERRHDVQLRRFASAVGGRDPDRDLLRRSLGVLDEDVEEAPVVEDAGGGELVLGPAALAAAVLRDEFGVGKGPLGIPVEQRHERVRRRVVDVVVALLHVLAMVSLVGRQAEEPLLEVVVAAVPERRREAEPLEAVADAADATVPRQRSDAPGRRLPG